MGKEKSSCCSRACCADRARGIKQEGWCKKLFMANGFLAAAIFCFVLAVLHYDRKTNADYINDDYRGLYGRLNLRKSIVYNGFNQVIDVDIPYNTCIYPDYDYPSDMSYGKFLELYQLLIEHCEGEEKKDCVRHGNFWYEVWYYNFIVLVILGVNNLILALGSVYFMPRLVGTVSNCFIGCCCHLPVILLALVARYNPFGEWCSWNMQANEYDRDGD